MTQKDYIKFAKMFRGERETYGNIVELGLIIDRVAEIFAGDSSKFNRSHFLKACEPSNNIKTLKLICTHCDSSASSVTKGKDAYGNEHTYCKRCFNCPCRVE